MSLVEIVKKSGDTRMKVVVSLFAVATGLAASLCLLFALLVAGGNGGVITLDFNSYGEHGFEFVLLFCGVVCQIVDGLVLRWRSVL